MISVSDVFLTRPAEADSNAVPPSLVETALILLSDLRDPSLLTIANLAGHSAPS